MGKMGQGSMVKLGQSKTKMQAYATKGVNDVKGDQTSSGKAPGKKLHPHAHVKYAKPNRSTKTGKKSRKVVIAA